MKTRNLPVLCTLPGILLLCACAPEPYALTLILNNPEGYHIDAIFHDTVRHMGLPASAANTEFTLYFQDAAYFPRDVGGFYYPETQEIAIRLGLESSHGLPRCWTVAHGIAHEIQHHLLWTNEGHPGHNAPFRHDWLDTLESECHKNPSRYYTETQEKL